MVLHASADASTERQMAAVFVPFQIEFIGVFEYSLIPVAGNIPQGHFVASLGLLAIQLRIHQGGAPHVNDQCLKVEHLLYRVGNEIRISSDLRHLFIFSCSAKRPTVMAFRIASLAPTVK